MADKPKNWVVMRRSGQTMDLSRGMGNKPTDTYLGILERIATEQSSAGSNYDSPDKLFLNGVCVVDGGLSSIAWRYQDDRNAAQHAATVAVRAEHVPEWIPEDEAEVWRGHHVAEWRVEKVR